MERHNIHMGWLENALLFPQFGFVKKLTQFAAQSLQQSFSQRFLYSTPRRYEHAR